jgi:hypothetical protein
VQHDDLYVIRCRQKRPGAVEAITALRPASHGQDGLPARFVPAHATLLQALRDAGPDRGDVLGGSVLTFAGLCAEASGARPRRSNAPAASASRTAAPATRTSPRLAGGAGETRTLAGLGVTSAAAAVVDPAAGAVSSRVFSGATGQSFVWSGTVFSGAAATGISSVGGSTLARSAGADDHPGLRPLGRSARADHLRHAEVEDLHDLALVPSGKKHVRRLEIPVHDPRLVRAPERPRPRMSSDAASAGPMNFTAIRTLRWRWRATQTDPMPPLASTRSSSYLPAMTAPA